MEDMLCLYMCTCLSKPVSVSVYFVFVYVSGWMGWITWSIGWITWSIGIKCEVHHIHV